MHQKALDFLAMHTNIDLSIVRSATRAPCDRRRTRTARRQEYATMDAGEPDPNESPEALQNLASRVGLRLPAKR